MTYSAVLNKKIVLFAAVFFILMINGGYAVSCGDTIYANTVLTSNLGPCTINGILIGANGITLDCKGYTISGDGNFSGNGVDTGSNNVVIKNCVITNFFYGIYSTGSFGNITNNTVYLNNDTGVLVNSGFRNSLTSNNVNNNAHGIWLYNSSNNSATSNTVNSNSNLGIIISMNSSYNNLINNTANSNSKTSPGLITNIIDIGIYITTNSNSNTLINNIANFNDAPANFGYGIVIEDSNNNTLTGNTANSNSKMGIGIYSSNYNIIQNNTFNSNRNRYGIFSNNSNYTVIKNNTANLNEIGILISQGVYNQIINNNASINTMLPFCGFGIQLYLTGNNTIINNIANANCAYGIYFSSGADSNTLINNTFNSNIEGIFISGGSNNVLINNTAMNNNASDFSSGYTGIYLSGPNSLNNLIKNLKTQQNLVSFTYKTDGLYNYVTLKGLTVAQAPQDPANYSNISKYVSATGNSANSWLYLNVSYADSDIPPGIIESTLRIWKYNSSGWTIADGSGVNGVDTANNVVYANITNFGSTFAPLGNNYSVQISNCPYTISNPGKYVLNQNISTTSGTCISINSNNVSLDCKGYKIGGNGTGYGVYAYGSNNDIADCVINNFYDGIFISQANNSYIENNSVTNSAYAGIVNGWESNNTYIIGNILNSNYWAGVFCQGSHYNTSLINNTANSNSLYGFYLTNNNLVKNNTLSSNGYSGLYLVSSSKSTVANNTITNSGSYGIRMLDVSNNTIRDNIIQFNPTGIIYETSTASNYNLVFNNFFRNTVNAYNTWTNYWNTTKTLGTNIIGGPFIGGNYWSDYNGVDTSNPLDRIGDTNLPYTSNGSISNGGDYLPLLPPDTTPPNIAILSPQNTTYYITSVPLTFTASEPASWCGYSLDGNANVTLASCANTTLTSLGYSSHNVIVYANDTSGNMGVSNRVYFTVLAPFCGDGIWQNGEWCGRDCLTAVGSTDMNHDCVVDTLDYLLITEHFGSTSYPSGDLNGDGVVNMKDIAIFVPHYGDFITNCTDAGQYFIDKKGSLSISFNNDTSNIINSTSVTVNSTLYAYIIASDVQNLTSLEFGLLSSPNLIFSGFSASPSLNLIAQGNESRIDIVIQSWQQPVSGPTVIGWATYNVIGTGNGNISIIKNSHFGKLEWSKPPEELYRANFANTLNGSVTVSTTTPNITILSPTNNTSYYKINVSLNFTISNNASQISWIGYSLNNTLNITIPGPVNLTGLANGWNNVTVFANDFTGIMGASNTTYFFYCLGDVSGPTLGVPDGKVDISDVAFVSKRFGASCGDPSPSKPTYDARADMNDDCKIDITDVATVAKQFGKTCK
jgi:parallel beta-helix repeat protein